MGSVEGLVIIACVAVAALAGIACALDEDGDFGVTPCLAERISCSRDEFFRILSARDVAMSPAAPRAWLSLGAPGLLAAVPGGLCLLI